MAKVFNTLRLRNRARTCVLYFSGEEAENVSAESNSGPNQSQTLFCFLHAFPHTAQGICKRNTGRIGYEDYGWQFDWDH